jgi:AcrR family transcriptional regulator
MAIADRRKREKKQRRKQIVDAAEKLFFAKNYDSVTMDEIADEAEVNKALLYYYFKNKESLFFAVVLRAGKIMNKLFIESSKSQKNGMDKLNDMGWAYYNFYKDFPEYYDIYIYFDHQRFKNSDNGYIHEIMKLRFDLVEMMCEAIEEGIKDGSIRKDVNPIEIAMFVATTSQAIVKVNPETLKALGISNEKYFEDSMDLYKRMLM